MPKPWHQRQKEQGAKLVLSWFAPRKCWKKYSSGEVKYFQQPNSAEGYEAAVLEYHSWLHKRKQTRPLGAEYEHHIQLFGSASTGTGGSARRKTRRGCMPKSQNWLRYWKRLLQKKNHCRF